MTLVKTEALILRSIPFQESSFIVRMFTREQGKIAVIAKGARRLKSDFRGLLEPLNYIDAIYYYKSTRDIQTLSKTDLIRSFLATSGNIESTVLGMALLETIDKIVRDHQHDSEIFDSAVAHLKAMDKTPQISQVVFICFLLELIGILGYRFNAKTCHRCRTELGDAVYHPGSAELLCNDCGRNISTEYRLSKSDVAFLANPQAEALYPHVDQEKLLRILLLYLSYHIDEALNLKSLRILPSIQT